MRGIDSVTGKTLRGVDHLRQSIADILTTPIGTRVMRRNYGSRLYELVDSPINAATSVEFYAATAEALMRWEPRFRLDRVKIASAKPGHVTIYLEGLYLPDNTQINVDGLQVIG